MASVWIESMHNLHCPTCDGRLIERAGRHDVMQRPDPVYIADAASGRCPEGHPLPHSDALYAYRDAQGHPAEAPFKELPRSEWPS